MRQNVLANGDDERHLKFDITGKTIKPYTVHRVQSTHTQMHIHMYTSNKTIKSTLRLSNLQWIHIWHGCLQICVHECVIVLHFQPVKHYEFAICLQHCGAGREREQQKPKHKSNMSCTIEHWLAHKMHFSLAIHEKFEFSTQSQIEFNMRRRRRAAVGVSGNLIEKSVDNSILISNSLPNATVVKCHLLQEIS